MKKRFILALVALFALVNVINVHATTACTFGLTLTGSSTVSIAQGSTYTDAGATAVDSCTNISSSIITVGLPVDTSVLGDHLITYNVGVSNPQNPDQTIFATPVTRTVTVFYEKKIEQRMASITVIKQTGPEEFAKSLKDFTFDLSRNDQLIATSSANAGNGVNATFTGLSAGTYDLTEEQYDGWTLGSPLERGRCVYENQSVGNAVVNGERITVDDGDSVVCTFVNIKSVNAITGGSAPTAPTSGGQVLGASTTTLQTKPAENPKTDTGASCSATIIKGYIKFGGQNDPEDVKVLQKFLNDHRDAKLPITGFYGPLTRAALVKFQVKEADAILKPWVDLGLLPNKENGTGYVFKTTQYRINTLLCPGLNIPAPILP